MNDYYYDQETSEHLIVRSGAELPERCIISGLDAGDADWRGQVALMWCPTPIIILSVLSAPFLFVPGAILLKLFRRSGVITCSMKREYRMDVLIRQGIGCALVVSAFVVVFATMVLKVTGSEMSVWPPVAVFAALLMLGLVILLMSAPIRAVHHQDGWFRVKGLSKAFLQTMPQRG